MKGLTEGLLVHYVLDTECSYGECRPAILVKVWRGDIQQRYPGSANLLVFVDGSNDGAPFVTELGGYPSTIWRTSVVNDEKEKKPGTWHGMGDNVTVE